MSRGVAKQSFLTRHYLREWRKHRGLTQEQAAELLGMDRTNLSKIERGRVGYSQSLLEAAATAYNCTLSDIVTRAPDEMDGPWALWERLAPPQRRQAIRLLRALSEENEPE